MVKLLAAVKRQGGAVTLRICERKVRGSFDVSRAVRKLGPHVEIRWSTKAREKVVWTQDTDWVDRWACFHGVEVPHHSSR
ncbi:MAG TPA: hypothetical protein VN864_02035, partial [Thermoplasmata archaeon]|nr:hypothetical protein [Thermoplasmata archaeon]